MFEIINYISIPSFASRFIRIYQAKWSFLTKPMDEFLVASEVAEVGKSISPPHTVPSIACTPKASSP